MTIYAIGDIQGCYDPLQRLLERVRFDPAKDRLWFTGDLVNRGPKSLEVLRFVRSLGPAAVTVLGNHDLHLLAVAHTAHRRLKGGDTLAPVLAADDSEALLHWLRHRPLLHHDPDQNAILVHAGLSPRWDLATARACAGEVEAVLRGEHFTAFLEVMYGNEPKQWDPGMAGWGRLRYIVNCLTRMRFCTPDGTLEFHHKGPLESGNGEAVPWFRIPGRPTTDVTILFGHWSALGLYLGRENVCALDTGCLWGGRLTALDVATRRPAADLDCPAAHPLRR